MHRYETLFVLHPELPEAQVRETIDRVRRLIEGMDGQIAEVQDWGMRDLAYPIRKQSPGLLRPCPVHRAARCGEGIGTHAQDGRRDPAIHLRALTGGQEVGEAHAPRRRSRRLQSRRAPAAPEQGS